MFAELLSVRIRRSNGESLAFYSKEGINNRPCQARQTLVNINFNEPLNYPFTVSVSICGGSYNTIEDSYSLVHVPNKVENMNIKIFNLISRLKQTNYLLKNVYLEN